MKVSILIAIILFSLPAASFAQDQYHVNNSRSGNIKLSGTSTLHKWDMNAKTFSGNAAFGFSAANKEQLTSLTALSFSLAVLDLNSKEKALNKNAHKALKSDQYKNIDYRLTSAVVQGGKANKYLLKTKGNLSIAGVTNEVNMNVYCVVNKDASITCSGSEHLKMTDYQVKPPTFMMGAMKTGDDLTLDFTMVYNK